MILGETEKWLSHFSSSETGKNKTKKPCGNGTLSKKNPLMCFDHLFFFLDEGKKKKK